MIQYGNCALQRPSGARFVELSDYAGGLNVIDVYIRYLV